MTARLLWDRRFDGSVLSAEARPLSGSVRDAFDITKLRAASVIIIGSDGCEQVGLSDGAHRIRVDIVHGSVLLGPVLLRYVLDDGRDLEAQLLTLRRFSALRRKGRFLKTLFPRERMGSRWIAALRACDALAAGASQRDLAAMLFGAVVAQTGWRGDSDFLRLRVQRLVRIGRRMTDRGYLTLLR